MMHNYGEGLAPRAGMTLDNDHTHSMRDPEMLAVYEADPLRFRKGTFRLTAEFMDAADSVKPEPGEQKCPGALHELYNDFGWREVVADVAGSLELQLALIEF
jgi:hypothetical protein